MKLNAGGTIPAQKGENNDIELPVNIGDKIGRGKEVKGVHVFVCEDGSIKKLRCHIGNGEFVSEQCDIHVKE